MCIVIRSAKVPRALGYLMNLALMSRVLCFVGPPQAMSTMIHVEVDCFPSNVSVRCSLVNELDYTRSDSSSRSQ